MALKISPKQLSTSIATIYTCPAGTEASIHGLVFSNNSDSSNTANLRFFENSSGTTYYLANNFSISSRSTYSWPRPINMQSGDSISSSAGANSIIFITASVYEGTTVASGFTPKGTWSGVTLYNTNDVVSYTSNSYIALQSSTNKNPITETTYWTILSERGSLGYTGSIGYTGSSGYTGSQGNLGYTGSQGNLGYTGSIGYTGSSGYTGSLGYTGSTVSGIPQNSQTNAYVLVKADSGKHISITTGGVSVPNTIFSAGDSVMVYNNSNAGQTVTQGVNVILKFAATTATGNRTLAGNGICSILCYAANSFVISGAGLT